MAAALHGLILLYEKQFQIAALRNTEPERISTSNLSTSVTPTGWINVSIDPPETETSFEANSSIASSLSSRAMAPKALINGSVDHSESQNELPSYGSVDSIGSSVVSGERFLDSLPRKGPGSQSFGPAGSLSSVTSSFGMKNLYSSVWKGMVFLASDPSPEVAELAQHVVHDVHDKVSGWQLWGAIVCYTCVLINFVGSYKLYEIVYNSVVTFIHLRM